MKRERATDFRGSFSWFTATTRRIPLRYYFVARKCYFFLVLVRHLINTIASRERGRIVARPAEEVIGGQDCDQFTSECCRDCSTCKCYNDDFDSCRVFNRME